MDEDAWAQARDRMVQEQLVTRGITDERVLVAMRRIPRHRFVPPDQAVHAAADSPLPIGLSQTISQPLMVAVMAEGLELTGAERVLEVGGGCGYAAAVLAELAAEVISVERLASLAESARRTLAALGITRVKMVVGDGSEGYVPLAPYDAISVAAYAPQIPPPLLQQLAPGGRMVIPVGTRAHQKLLIVKKDQSGRAIVEERGNVVFVPLIGRYGRPEEPEEGISPP